MQHNEAAIAYRKKSVTTTLLPICERLMMMGVLAFIANPPAVAQNVEVLQELVAVKQAAAENKQKLQQYQWIETTQLTWPYLISPRKPIRNSSLESCGI